jgi:predicted DNA-binding transcriptional regulator YafY
MDQERGELRTFRVDRMILPRRLTVAVVSEAEPGWVTIEINAESLDWVPPLLARLGCPFHVVQPQALNAAVEALGRRLLEASCGPEASGGA